MSIRCSTSTQCKIRSGSGVPFRAPRERDWYGTSFDSTESVISEGGNWKTNFGQNWTVCSTSGGRCFGTQPLNDNFDDSYAYINGLWSPDQEVGGVVFKGVTSGIQEVENNMRIIDGPGFCYLYEVNWAYDGSYVDFIRWNGPRGTSVSDFTFLVPSGTFSTTINNGDTLVARIQGFTITAFRNGVQVGTATDTSAQKLRYGQPGLGFFRTSDGGANDQFCWSSYWARSL